MSNKESRGMPNVLFQLNPFKAVKLGVAASSIKTQHHYGHNKECFFTRSNTTLVQRLESHVSLQSRDTWRYQNICLTKYRFMLKLDICQGRCQVTCQALANLSSGFFV